MIDSPVIFEDREDAASLLAARLTHCRGKNLLVLAIPRGAVAMGRIIADKLEGELDVVLVRKLSAPDNPEFAIGAVDESGWVYVAEYAEQVGASAAYVEREKQAQLEIMRRRRERYTPARPPIDPAGRVVIVVDDGLATGATMISALHAVRAKHPARLICAVPVAAPRALEKVAAYADETVCLVAPDYFRAVAQFYTYFPQVSDDEVISILQHDTEERGLRSHSHAEQ
jgi:putative phosphoribosyl transferase